MNRVLGVLILFFAVISPLYAANSDWLLRYNQNGITVYTRPVAGSSLEEFKSTMTVNAPMDKVLSIYENETILNKWFYQCVHAELLKDEGGSKVLYTVFHLPWPVSERDSIFRRTKSVDEGVVTYTIEALPQYLPPKSGKVRVVMIHSQWRFTPKPDGTTEIYFQQHCNPGGSLPPFIVNALAVDTPVKSLGALRRLLLDKN